MDLPPARTSTRIGPRAPVNECLVSVGVAIAEGSAALGNRRLEELDFSSAGVQPGFDAEWESPLLLDMSDGKTVGGGNTEGPEVVSQYLIEAEGAVSVAPLQVSEAADHDAGQPLECSTQSQVGKHPVHAVQVLTGVLEKENGAGHVGKIRRTDQTLQQGQVAADQQPLGDTGVKRDDSVFLL